MIKVCCAATIISAGMMIVGCSPSWNLLSEQSWTVSGSEIHETIEISTSNWPDHRFKRTYTLLQAGRKLDVGSYDNESSLGVLGKPYAVDEFIVIPTSSYIYLVGPDDQVKTFYPWMADQWMDFAEPRGINGHYDYHVDTVQKIDGGWKLVYRLQEGLNGQRPKVIHFVTTDNWQSFQVETR
ncbi:MAG: hypothetical protein R3C14_19035 [Caldilineaceae bacterium]